MERIYVVLSIYQLQFECDESNLKLYIAFKYHAWNFFLIN